MLLVLLAVITPMLLVIILCLIMRCCRSINRNTRSYNDDKYSNEKSPSIAMIPPAKIQVTHSLESSENNFYIQPERNETTLYLNDYTKCPINQVDKNIDNYHKQINNHDEFETTSSMNNFSNRHVFRPIECEDNSSRMSGFIYPHEEFLTPSHEYSHAICNPLKQISCRHTSPTVRKSVR